MICIFDLGYAIRRVQVIQDGLLFNGTYQVLAYADYVNVLGDVPVRHPPCVLK